MDRRTWLNGLVTCDLAPLAEGDVAYGLFTTQKGRILADALVFLDGDRVLVAVPRATLAELRASLDHYLIMEDVEIADAGVRGRAVHGPRAGRGPRGGARSGGARRGDRPHRARRGVALRARARPRFGQLRGAATLRSRRSGVLGDDRAWEALRLDRRVPQFGADFDAATYPQEAGLEKRAISFSKGCYLGQEVVCMLEMRGHVKRRLVTLRVTGDLPPPRGAGVTDAAGEQVGAVTSAAIVPSAGGPVAMAMVKRAQSESGVQLRVAGASATVIAPA